MRSRGRDEPGRPLGLEAEALETLVELGQLAALVVQPVDARPGTVVAIQPLVKIATGRGTISLRVAFRQKPVPWIWPAFGSRPEVGEVLPSGPPESG